MKHIKDYKQFELNENFSDVKLYHISPSSNRSDIQSNGIVSTNEKRYRNISDDKVYVWEHLKMAMWYALTESRDYSKEFDIWEIEYNGSMEEDESIGIPFAMKIESVSISNIKLIDSVTPKDSRLSSYSDLDDIIDDIIDGIGFD